MSEEKGKEDSFIDMNELRGISNAVCQVINKDEKSTGFFIKNRNEVKFLVTNSHIITKEMIYFGKVITIKYQEGKEERNIVLDQKREILTYTKKDGGDISLTEIYDEDNLTGAIYMEVDNDYFINGQKTYLNKNINIIENQLDGTLKLSKGRIDKVNEEKEYYFTHTASVNADSSGSPVILDNLKIIGINLGVQEENKENYGTFLGSILIKVNNRELTLKDGSKYIGEFKKDKFEGKGTYTWADGSKYIGEFKDGKKEGKGTYTDSDGSQYIGEFKNDQKEGQGTYIDVNGNKYIGEFKEGFQNGQGTFNWKDGRKYEGEFKNDKIEGQGTYIWVNGNKYTGEFKGGKKEGKGTYTTSDGSNYIGEFKNDKKDGKGEYTDKEGNKYVGEFKNDKKEGKGTYTCPDGYVYIGEFKEGLQDGQGEYTDPDGNKYIGEFKKGLEEGQGTFTWEDGSKYIGEFKEGKKEGKGTYIDTDGSQYIGEYKNDEKVN